MKTRVKVKFKDGKEKVLDDVHVIIWDRVMENIEDDKYVVIIFNDPGKGTGTMFAEREAIDELSISLYSDIMFS